MLHFHTVAIMINDQKMNNNQNKQKFKSIQNKNNNI